MKKMSTREMCRRALFASYLTSFGKVSKETARVQSLSIMKV